MADKQTLYGIQVLKPVDAHSKATLISTVVKKNVPLGKYTATEVSGKMYYVPSLGGWIDTSDMTKAKVVSVLAADSTDKNVSGAQDIFNKFDDLKNPLGIDNLVGIVTDSLESLLNASISANTKFDASTRLYGQPFQFNATTDFRLSKELELGRKYVETIIAESPIVYMLPGRATYLPELLEKEREAITNVLESATNAIEKAVKEDILKAEQRYFDFVPDYTSYMNYVNALCRVGASYMGIGDLDAPVKAFRQKYRYFDWGNYKYEEAYTNSMEKSPDKSFTLQNTKETIEDTLTQAYESWIGSYQYTQFYVDPSTSFQESSTNTSGTSAVQSYLEKAQGMVKEISFMGTAASSATGVPDAINATKDLLSGGLDIFSAGIFGKIANNSKVIVDGGNIMFPEIWGDSSYNKSYTVSTTLISPYGDKESIYLHVLVPLFHMMAFALPRQLSANGFGQPFFVKASCKGWFNCELGMVESISIEKVQGSYSVNGLPTEIRVDMSIKDLYPMMMASSSTQPGLFFENKSLTNWLAITCGLNIAEPNFTEKWKTVLTSMIAGAAMDIPGNIFERVLETGRNALQKFIGF